MPIAAMLLAAAASAAPPPPAFGPDQPSAASPHNCESFYPPLPLLNNIEGRTLVAFTVGADGRVTEPAVHESSGNIDLDDAAKRCVLRWTYRPAAKDGVPVAAPWMAYVVWRQRYHLTVVSAPTCSVPPQARTQPPGSKTVVLYVVDTEGKTASIGVAVSSGDDALDDAVSACVASWRFKPYLEDGRPVDYPTSQTVLWTPPD